MPGQPRKRNYAHQIVRAHGSLDAALDLIASGRTIASLAAEAGLSRQAWLLGLKAAAAKASGVSGAGAIAAGEEIYRRARAAAAGAHAERALEIADEAEPGRERIADLQIRSRQWLAERMNPDEWGGKPAVGVEIRVGELHLGALRQPDAGPPELPPAA